MMKRFLITAAAVLLSGQVAQAAVTAGTLISDLQAQGYTWIEVKRGPAQIKVEAVRGTEKVEFVVDAATGTVLEREVERADRDEIGRTGVQVADRRGDFVSADGRDLDDDDDHYDDDDRYDDRDDRDDDHGHDRDDDRDYDDGDDD